MIVNRVLMFLCIVGVVLLRQSSAERETRSTFTLRPRYQDSDNVLENIYLKTPDIVRKYGYPVETHTVTTDDGYLLTVHRIPGSPKAPSSGVKTPVLLMHALLMASDVWVARGPEIGLGFLLADQGYDVWLGNARGNLYSRNHVTLSPEDNDYWDFTVHEMGVYDLPAVIDHILMTTNHQQLFYIGHSMGNPMFFVLGSTRPEYNDKVRLMIAMAPGVFNEGKVSLLSLSLRVVGNINSTEVFPRSTTVNSLLSFACQDRQIFQTFCSLSFSQLFGNNPKQLNTTLLPLYLALSLSGTSSGSMGHFGQIFQIGRFQTYDRDARRRGSLSKTPEYNLSLVTAPVVIMYAQNDAILSQKGIFKLSKELPNVLRTIRLADDQATHSDFIFANKVKTLAYDDVIRLMDQYR